MIQTIVNPCTSHRNLLTTYNALVLVCLFDQMFFRFCDVVFSNQTFDKWTYLVYKSVELFYCVIFNTYIQLWSFENVVLKTMFVFFYSFYVVLFMLKWCSNMFLYKKNSRPQRIYSISHCAVYCQCSDGIYIHQFSIDFKRAHHSSDTIHDGRIWWV